MAHELAFKADGNAAMAYTGEKPWHGLGQQLDADADLNTWVEAAGFNWEVKRAPIHFEQRDDENAPVCIRTVPNRWALYRSDNGNPLSVMSSNYQITQPRQVMEFFRELIEIGGFKMETAGQLRGGSTYWALAKADDSFDVGGGDRVLPYLLLASSCDGSLSNLAQFETIRVVCNNTLSMAASRQDEGQVRIPHSTKFNAELIKTRLGLIGGSWERFKKDAVELSKREVSKEEAARFITQVLYDQDEIDEEETTVTRPMLKLVTEIYLNGIGQNTKTAQGTAWGLVNAFTRFVDHERKSSSNDSRLQSAWFGSGARLKDKAYAQALAML
jgi:phage/plasmid-like protein (TIGR03299 family)